MLPAICEQILKAVPNKITAVQPLSYIARWTNNEKLVDI